jgi:Protein of unknown function (DUF2809)
MLWAAAIYWLLAALLPRVRPLRLALFAALVATAIECLKLYRQPALDAFRLTLAGKLILGRIFSLRDIAVYGLAIAIAVLLDRRYLKEQQQCL